jgi:hypothetical protein
MKTFRVSMTTHDRCVFVRSVKGESLEEVEQHLKMSITSGSLKEYKILGEIDD